MTRDDEPRAATPSEEQRAAARRALEAERAASGEATAPTGEVPPWRRSAVSGSAAADGPPTDVRPEGGAATAPPPGTGDEVPGGPSRTPLVVGIVLVVAVLVVAAVWLLGGDDDGETATEGPSTTTTTTSSTTAEESTTTTDGDASSTTEATSTTPTSELPADIPPPAGDPRPDLDLTTDDIEQLAEQTATFRLWLYANPDVAVAAAITAPGSPARQRLVDEIGRLEQAGQLAIYEGYTYEVDEASSDGDVAEATWAEAYDQYHVYDAATGQIVIDLEGLPLAGYQLRWTRSDAGEWLLEEFVGG